MVVLFDDREARMLKFDESTSLEIDSLESWLQYARSGGRLVDAVGFCDRYYNMPEQEGWLIPGECNVCETRSEFWIDRLYSGTMVPNWRERVVCVKCGLNCRMRFAVDQAQKEIRKGARVYCTEYITELYKELSRHFVVTGSEFLPDVASGTIVDGMRIEDVTRLSFRSSSFDAVLTFDVLEHFPDYDRALEEFHRVLVRDGVLLMTVPFDLSRDRNLLRAEYVNGELVHHEPIEMHGDPMNPEEGILSYHTFGWELVERLKQHGFCTKVRMTLSPRHGYLGQTGPFIVARKI